MNRENSDFRDRFAGTAAEYRRRELQLTFVLGPLLLFSWYAVFFLSNAKVWAIVSFLLFSAGVLFGKHITTRLVCPACEHELTAELIRFCPECGSWRVQSKGDDKYFLPAPHCEACGRKLSRKRGGERRYRIRFCTRCGAYLDERGV